MSQLCHTLYSWDNYISSCSAHSNERLLNLWHSQYENQVVRWEGKVVMDSYDKVTILPNPPEQGIDNFFIILNMNPQLLGMYRYKRDIGQSLYFDGIIRNLGESSVEVDAIPFNSSARPNFSISVFRFLNLFGSNAQKAPNRFFENIWKNTQILLVGFFRQFREIQFRENLYLAIEFIISPFFSSKVEDVVLLVLLSNKNFVSFCKMRDPNTQLEVCATIIERGSLTMPHVMELVSITNCGKRLNYQSTPSISSVSFSSPSFNQGHISRPSSAAVTASNPLLLPSFPVAAVPSYGQQWQYAHVVPEQEQLKLSIEESIGPSAPQFGQSTYNFQLAEIQQEIKERPKEEEEEEHIEPQREPTPEFAKMNKKEEDNMGFRCALSREIMSDPVKTPGGTVYDRESLMNFIKSTNMWPDSFEDVTYEEAKNLIVSEEELKGTIDRYLLLYPERKEEKD